MELLFRKGRDATDYVSGEAMDEVEGVALNTIEATAFDLEIQGVEQAVALRVRGIYPEMFQ